MGKKGLVGFIVFLFCSALLVQAQTPEIGGRIVFVSDRDGTTNLWIQDLSDNSVMKLTDFPGELGIQGLCYPQWSNDGRRVMFSAGQQPNSGWQIYVINDDGCGLQKLTNYECQGTLYNRWDPKDDNVFYCLQCNGWGNEVFHRVNIATGEDSAFSPSPDAGENSSSGDWWFQVTPDGQNILFTRNHSYQYQYIGYQDYAGQLKRIIATDLNALEIGDINRLDNWVLYYKSPGFPFFGTGNNIGKINPDSLGDPVLVPLTTGDSPENNMYPCWTQEDNEGYIIFQSNIFGNNEIVLMKADGSSYPGGIINLTKDPSNDSCPDWTPHGRNKYTFEGFSGSIETMPTVNKAHAGQIIPVMWRITNACGLPVSDPASFVGLTSYGVSCTTFEGDPTNTVAATAPGSSGLQYLGDGWWQFNWRTSKTYSGQCRIMKLTLDDKTEYTANFSFK